MEVKRDEDFIASFVGKLGHPLQEIRVRALKNIAQKLELGLVSESQLATNRQLLKALLQWFNLDTQSNSDVALNLLLKLSKHSDARVDLARHGAVEFLSKLRQKVNTEMQSIVDGILENLFLLPDLDVSVANDAAVEVAVISSDPPSIRPVLQPMDVAHRVEVGGTAPSSERYEGNLIVNDLPQTTSTTSASQHEYSGFKLISLKWVSVSETDLRILQSTNNSIESHENQQIINACNFLTDVVLRDFPAEVFLQYSSTITNLLQLMVSNTNEPHRLGLQVLKCLTCLTHTLLARVSCCQDAAMYNTKQDPGSLSETSSSQSSGSLESRPSVVGQSDPRPCGDGQDGDTSSSYDNAAQAVSCNDVDWTNRSQEISVPHFCLLVFRHSATLLHFPNPQVLHSVVELLQYAAKLLKECVLPSIWNDPSTLAQDLGRKFVECFDALALVIVKKQEKYNNACNPTTGNTFKIHLAAARCASTALANLLTISVSPSQISSIGLSEVTFNALSLLVLDFAFENSYTELHKVFLDYAEQLGSNAYLEHSEVVHGRHSLKSAVSLVNLIKEEKFESTDFIRLACEALPALAYYRYWEFIDCFIHCISHLCKQETTTPTQMAALNNVMLKLLAYPEQEIKTVVYQSCLTLVEKSFGVQQAADPLCTASSSVKFLFDTTILTAIICHGFDCPVEEISQVSHQIFLFLLNGKMLMTAELWETFMNSLLHIMPIIQAYTTAQTPLGLTLFRLVDTTNRDWSIEQLLTFNIRLLFSKDSRLRLQVIPRIVWFLAKEEDSLHKLPALSKLDASPLANLFIGHRSCRLSLLTHTASSHAGNIRQLLELFVCKSETANTRKTAGHQLAFFINDETSYSVFQSADGLKQVIFTLQSMLITDLQSSIEACDNLGLIPMAIELILQVISRDREASQHISTNSSVFYSLLRAALLFSTDTKVASNVAEILAFLLFQDVYTFDNGLQMSVSSQNAAIAKWFDLPFNVTVVSDDNVESEVVPFTVTSRDPYIVRLMETHCRLAWNATLLGGWEKILSKDTIPESHSFPLNNIDRHLIKAAQHDLIIMNHLQDIICANSHKAVLVSLKFLSLEIVAIPNTYLKDAHFVDIGLFDQAFSKFLKVHPKSSADKTLVRHILQFFTFALSCKRICSNALIAWMYDQINLKDGAIYYLMRHPHDPLSADETDLTVYSPLTRELVTFIIALLSTTPYCDGANRKLGSIQRSIYGMIHFVLQHLNLAEAPQFYNLASLEAVLQCLVHITARPGFSLQKTATIGQTICQQLTGLLMEVLAAFHLSRDNNTHSFMGRGVTVAATVSLSHIASETRSISTGDEWIRNWFYVLEQPEGSPQTGLGWLIPLWTHMDPEVRAASIGIVVSFTATKMGCELASANIQQVAGGLWGVALSFLLEHSEACMVREQAALMLANLTVHSMAENKNSSPHLAVPPMDRAAILSLLQNSNFTKEIAITISNYTPHQWLQSYIQNKAARPVPTNLSTSCTLIATDFGIINLSLSAAGLPYCDHQSDTSTSQGTSRETVLVERAETRLFTLASRTLVSGICLFFQNLVLVAPQEIILAMKRESIFECLLRVLEDSKSLFISTNNSANVQTEMLHMHASILQLLGTCCAQDSWLRTYMQNNQKIINELYWYLQHSAIKDFQQREIQEVHKSVYKLLILLSFEMTKVNARNVVAVLTKELPIIVKNLALVLSSDADESLKTAAIMWLSCTLASLDKMETSNQITTLLDAKSTYGENKEHGIIILTALLKVHGKSCASLATKDDSNMRITCDAIGIIFVLSESAKQAALECKFYENVVERIRKGMNRTEFGTAVHSRHNSKTKDFHHVRDIVRHLDILTNFLYKNHKGKIAVNKFGLCALLTEYWSLIIANKTTILPSVLSLLCTYTAHCPPAAKSLALNKAYSSAAAGTGNVANKVVLSGGVLLHEIIKACQAQLTRLDKDGRDILDKLFTLLATVSLVPICRGVICKQSKFLQNFSTLIAKKSSGGNRASQLKDDSSIISLWLQLFANISFKSEGQDIVLNIPDLLDTLLDLVENGSNELRGVSLIVLRNLCFLPAGKTKLLGNTKFLSIITALALDQNDKEHLQMTAAMTLWILTANSQKGKLVLKGDHFVDRLEDTIEVMYSQAEPDSFRTRTLNILTTVFSFLQNTKE